jgi:mono/diheme cytochrome c family protein
MRASRNVAMLVLALIIAPSALLAGELQFGRAGIPQSLPSLGPAGDGRRLYLELNCYLCHGDNGAGSEGPNIQGAEFGDVQETVTQGDPEAGMPAFGKYVTTTDLKNITAYLDSIGTTAEPKWFDWWVPHPKK